MPNCGKSAVCLPVFVLVACSQCAALPMMTYVQGCEYPPICWSASHQQLSLQLLDDKQASQIQLLRKMPFVQSQHLTSTAVLCCDIPKYHAQLSNFQAQFRKHSQSNIAADPPAVFCISAVTNSAWMMESFRLSCAARYDSCRHHAKG